MIVNARPSSENVALPKDTGTVTRCAPWPTHCRTSERNDRAARRAAMVATSKILDVDESGET